MGHISGFVREHFPLMPEAVDDNVDTENAARFIGAFVDAPDLAATRLPRIEAKATGPPSYAPGDLLKFYIYGRLARLGVKPRGDRSFGISRRSFAPSVPCRETRTYPWRTVR
jgi:hypothetical protein